MKKFVSLSVFSLILVSLTGCYSVDKNNANKEIVENINTNFNLVNDFNLNKFENNKSDKSMKNSAYKPVDKISYKNEISVNTKDDFVYNCLSTVVDLNNLVVKYLTNAKNQCLEQLKLDFKNEIPSLKVNDKNYLYFNFTSDDKNEVVYNNPDGGIYKAFSYSGISDEIFINEKSIVFYEGFKNIVFSKLFVADGLPSSLFDSFYKVDFNEEGKVDSVVVSHILWDGYKQQVIMRRNGENIEYIEYGYFLNKNFSKEDIEFSTIITSIFKGDICYSSDYEYRRNSDIFPKLEIFDFDSDKGMWVEQINYLDRGDCGIYPFAGALDINNLLCEGAKNFVFEDNFTDYSMGFLGYLAKQIILNNGKEIDVMDSVGFDKLYPDCSLLVYDKETKTFLPYRLAYGGYLTSDYYLKDLSLYDIFTELLKEYEIDIINEESFIETLKSIKYKDFFDQDFLMSISNKELVEEWSDKNIVDITNIDELVDPFKGALNNLSNK